MKKFLKSLFFPGVPYPAAIIWHLILGGFVAFLLVLVISGQAAATAYSTGIIGGGIGLVAGFLVWLFTREEVAGVTRQRYVAEGKYFNEVQATSGLAVMQYPGKWRAAKEYVSQNQSVRTAPDYWDAVRLHYLEIGGLWSDQVGK